MTQILGEVIYVIWQIEIIGTDLFAHYFILLSISFSWLFIKRHSVYIFKNDMKLQH